jgi:hypothetical protein
MAVNEQNMMRAQQEGRMFSNGRTTVAHNFYRTIDQVREDTF